MPEEIETEAPEFDPNLPTPRAPTSAARTFKVTVYLPPGKTSREAIEWMQKYFDFFHKSLEAQVEEEL